MRYQGDFAPALGLMSCVGAWAWLALFRRRVPRTIAAVVFIVLAAATIAAGALLGFTGYFNHFQRHNPELLKTLHRVYVCKGA
jgi:sterol desaturase/sphingolipid hydroxylase (fatty acid hydroxylase superfamily)